MSAGSVMVNRTSSASGRGGNTSSVFLTAGRSSTASAPSITLSISAWVTALVDFGLLNLLMAGVSLIPVRCGFGGENIPKQCVQFRYGLLIGLDHFGCGQAHQMRLGDALAVAYPAWGHFQRFGVLGKCGLGLGVVVADGVSPVDQCHGAQ